MGSTWLPALLLAIVLLFPVSSAVADQSSHPSLPPTLQQSPLPQQAAPQPYPKIVLYSVSWCPHCKAAKEYFTRNNIPFINRDVEIDEQAMALLTEKYKSQSVPIIVIGDDQEIIRGFDEDKVEKILEKYKKR